VAAPKVYDDDDDDNDDDDDIIFRYRASLMQWNGVRAE